MTTSTTRTNLHTITTVAGTGFPVFNSDGQASSANLYYPLGVAAGNNGEVYIADWYNHRIRKVDTEGIITTVAGTGIQGFSGDGGSAQSAKLNFPSGVTVDQHGVLYIADEFNHRVRKVTASGTPPHPLRGADLYGEPVVPATVARGTEIDLGVRIKNRGPEIASGDDVRVTLTLPESMGIDPSTRDRNFPGAQLKPEEGSLDGVFRFSLPDSVPLGHYVATARIEYPEEIHPSDNTDELPFTVVGQRDTAVDIPVSIVGPEKAAAGEEVTYTITVQNKGTHDAPDAAVDGTIPEELANARISKVDTSGGASTRAEGTISNGKLHQPLNLPKGSSATITVTGTIDSNYTGTLTLTVEASGGTPGNTSEHRKADFTTHITQTTKKLLLTEQETDIDAAPGDITFFGFSVRPRSGKEKEQINPGATTHTVTAPAGYEFVHIAKRTLKIATVGDIPIPEFTPPVMYSYYHDDENVTGNGSLKPTISEDRKTLTFSHNPTFNTQPLHADSGRLVYQVMVRATGDAQTGPQSGGQVRVPIAEPNPLALDASVSQQSTSNRTHHTENGVKLTLQQLVLPKRVRPGENTALSIIISTGDPSALLGDLSRLSGNSNPDMGLLLNLGGEYNDYMAPKSFNGKISGTFTAPTGLHFTGWVSYSYYHTKEMTPSGNGEGKAQRVTTDGGKQLSIDDNVELNPNGKGDAIVYTLYVKADENAPAGTHRDGKFTIGETTLPLRGTIKG
jgi:uncharacterized repeat protein (TIGR01451 family)